MKDNRSAGADEARNLRLARNFIDKIERDRDRVLETVEHETRNTIREIRKDAYRSARNFQRVSAGQTRQRCRWESDLHLARATARLRRESWRALHRLKSSALSRVRTRLNQMYVEPGPQWCWCRHWLLVACKQSSGESLKITLGRRTLARTRSRLEEFLGTRIDSWTVAVDDELGYGLTIAWGRQLLDGRLESQMHHLADEVFKHLAVELHTRQKGETG